MRAAFRLSHLLLALLIVPAAPGQTVLVQPYVQPGDRSTLDGTDTMVVMWLTDQLPGEFVVEFGPTNAPLRSTKPEKVQLDFAPAKPKSEKKPAAPNEDEPPAKEVATDSAPNRGQHYFKYAATLTDLPFDSLVTYRVKLGARHVREASFATRASTGKPIRFVMVGDLANGQLQQNAVAFQINRVQPQFLVVLGDIVYPEGRVSQYMHHFWGTYDQPLTASPRTGAPLMASIPFYAVLGNHDVDTHNLAATPDALGAYHFFRAPTNGPGEGIWNTPLGKGPEAATFRAAVGASYPALAVYSFDNGPAHFLILDNSGYANLETPKLREWIEADLRGSPAPWKFVCIHGPIFHSSREHYPEQKMRLLAPLFESCGVDIVFAGHVHNYQRSVPLRFKPNPPKRLPGGYVNGEFQLDTKFDGKTNTQPDGVIHVVSGGGGATLYSVNYEKTVAALKKDHPENYVPITARHFADEHSFSYIEITPTAFNHRQISITGEEVDRFTITKPAR